jgi:CheY-like chemotaxis protein
MAAILIVDDDTPTRDTLRAVLEDGGHAVSEATGGENGLELLRKAPAPVIVLLDQLMPMLDGEGVLEQVAGAGKELRRHAFVLLTAGAHRLSPRLAELLSTLGVPVVAKPFDIDALLAAVAAASATIVRTK